MADRFYLIDKGYDEESPAFVLCETPNRDWADSHSVEVAETVLSREEAIRQGYGATIAAWERRDDSAFAENELRWTAWSSGFDEVRRHVVETGGTGDDFVDALETWGISKERPLKDPDTDEFADFAEFADAVGQRIPWSCVAPVPESRRGQP